MNKHFIPLVTLGLVLINVLLYSTGWLQHNFSIDALTHHPWWIFQAMFSHGSLGHLAGNMLFLMLFGPPVEKHLGHGWFLLVYLLAGVGASLGFGLIESAAGLGASGAIAGIIAIYPFAQTNWISTVLSGGAVLYLLATDFLSGYAGYPDGVAHLAHAAGAVSGLLLYAAQHRRGRYP